MKMKKMKMRMKMNEQEEKNENDDLKKYPSIEAPTKDESEKDFRNSSIFPYLQSCSKDFLKIFNSL